jgi:copper resistance protein C
MSSTSSSRRLSTVLAAGIALSFAFGAALVTSVVSAAPASAHAVMVKMAPAAGARLASAPTEVVVDFDEPVSTTFATVVVTSKAGISVAQGKPVVLGGKVTQALSPNLASGSYRISYRVVSSDGHPVTGGSEFTLALAPGSAPTPTAKAPAATPKAPAATPGAPAATPNRPIAAAPPAVEPKASQDGFLARFLVPIIGAVGLLIAGAGLLVWERQRR